MLDLPALLAGRIRIKGNSVILVLNRAALAGATSVGCLGWYSSFSQVICCDGQWALSRISVTGPCLEFLIV